MTSRRSSGSMRADSIALLRLRLRLRQQLLRPHALRLRLDLHLKLGGVLTGRHSQSRFASKRSSVRLPIAKRNLEAEHGRVSRVSPVHTAIRNCTRDEGGPFEVGNQVLISSHRKLLLSKAMVVSVAETAGRDPVRQG